MKVSQLNLFWQSLGGLLAPIILTLLLLQLATGEITNFYQWLIWLHLPLFFLHEYEEYVLNPDGFKKFVNSDTFLALKPPLDNTPLDDLMILVINLGAWLWAFSGAILAPVYPWLGAGFLVFQILINCLTHPLIFQFQAKGYNPGLATTLLFFLPHITFTFWYVINQHLFALTDWRLTLLVGVGVSALLPLWSFTRLHRVQAPLTAPESSPQAR